MLQNHSFFIIGNSVESNFLQKLESKLLKVHPELIIISTDEDYIINLETTQATTLFALPKLTLSHRELIALESIHHKTFWVISAIAPGVSLNNPSLSFFFRDEIKSPVIPNSSMVMDYLTWVKSSEH